MSRKMQDVATLDSSEAERILEISENSDVEVEEYVDEDEE